MEIFSFFQNLQLLAFGKNLTQGGQENQAAEPGAFEALMNGFELQEEQPEVSFAVNDAPKVMASGIENVRAFQPVNVAPVPDVSEEVETKAEAPEPSTSWQNLFSDNRRAADVPAVKGQNLPDDVDFDNGVVPDYSDDSQVVIKPNSEKKADSEDVKPAVREADIPENPKPVEAPEITRTELNEADEVVKREEVTEPRETSKPAETVKPEVKEIPVKEPESLPVTTSDYSKIETEEPKSVEAEPILTETKKIELTDTDVPEVPHEEPVKPSEPSEVKTVEKVSYDEEPGTKKTPETPRDVREAVDEKPKVDQPQTVTEPREVSVKNYPDSQEPEAVERREIPKVKAADGNTVIRSSDIEKSEEPEEPKKPEESPEAPDTAVVMAGFSAVQTAPAAPNPSASESPDVPVSTRSERPRNTPRTTRSSQDIKPETREQVQPQTQTRSTKTDDAPEKSPKPQVGQQKTSPNESDNEAPVSTTSTTTPTSSTSTTRASRTTERTETRRSSNVHSDFQSFFDGITRTRRTSSTARANAQPLSLRTSTYTEQPQAPTMRNGIVNVVRFIRADGVRKANIIVDPPAIGRISVELTSTSSGVEASIKVASEQIRQILQNQVTQLRDNLLQQGVQVSEFTVDVQQDNSQQGQNSGNENRQTPYDFTAGNNEDDDTEDFRIDLEEGLLYWIA